MVSNSEVKADIPHLLSEHDVVYQMWVGKVFGCLQGCDRSRTEIWKNHLDTVEIGWCDNARLAW